MPESAKGPLIKQYTEGAVSAYSRICTRYPLESRASDAKKRLIAMKQPVPQATPQAIAQDKAEIASRGSLGTVGKVIENFHKGPDVSEAAKVGEPTLVDPKQASAPDIVREANASVASILQGAGVNSVSVEQVKPGSAPPESQAVPRSGSTPAAGGDANPAVAAGGPVNGGAADGTTNTTAGSDMQNDLAPAAGTGTAPVPPPTQVNEVANSDSASSTPQATAAGQTQAAPATTDTESSSKKKKKHHLIPF